MLWKRFEIKSHQRRACYLKPHRNGGPIPTGGGGARGAPPHTLTKVNRTIYFKPSVTNVEIVQYFKIETFFETCTINRNFALWRLS